MLNLRPLDAAFPIERQFAHPDFVGALAAYPSSAVAQPHLFARVAVPNQCAA